LYTDEGLRVAGLGSRLVKFQQGEQFPQRSTCKAGKNKLGGINMKKQDLLKTLTGEHGEGRSFRVSTKWVEENDWEVYDCLHNLMAEFVEDETNLADENDLAAFENGEWEVEYTFNGYFEDEEIEILVTAGRNGQHIANQPAWIQEKITLDEFMDCWNWETYLEQID